MSSKDDNQQRHEKLIDFLNAFSQYNYANGEKMLHKVSKELTSEKFQNISTNDINHAVVVLTDVLNLSGGSVGTDIDLYELLQAYLQVPDSRKPINEIVRKALFNHVSHENI